jgi:hypothetical protein
LSQTIPEERMLIRKKVLLLLLFSLIAICSLNGAEAIKKAPIEDKAIVFRGIAFERYHLPEILKALNIKNVKEYSVTNNAPALTPANKFRLDKLPRIFTKQAPKYIIMADFSLNKGVIPNIVLKSLIKDVKRGSTLVILGGLFTLNKGEFKDTPLAPLLPVKTDSPWAVKKLKTPLETPGGSVAYIHDIPLTADTKTLFSADKKPLWVSKKCENGRIIVFLGIPSGTSESNLPLFWKNNKWPKFAASIIKE